MFKPNEPHEVQNVGGYVVPIYRQDDICYFSHTLQEINDPLLDFTDVIIPRSQNPYASVIMAQLAMKAKRLRYETHTIARYNGGYGIICRQD